MIEAKPKDVLEWAMEQVLIISPDLVDNVSVQIMGMIESHPTVKAGEVDRYAVALQMIATHRIAAIQIIKVMVDEAGGAPDGVERFAAKLETALASLSDTGGIDQ